MNSNMQGSSLTCASVISNNIFDKYFITETNERLYTKCFIKYCLFTELIAFVPDEKSRWQTNQFCMGALLFRDLHCQDTRLLGS